MALCCSRAYRCRASRWQELETAHIGMVMAGAGLRPGRMSADHSMAAHVLAYHDLTRLIELLMLWRLDTIAYPEIAYVAGQISMTPGRRGSADGVFCVARVWRHD